MDIPVDMSRISVGVDGEEIDDVDNSNKKDEKQNVLVFGIEIFYFFCDLFRSFKQI